MSLSGTGERVAPVLDVPSRDVLSAHPTVYDRV
jgi:hypothetical protein